LSKTLVRFLSTEDDIPQLDLFLDWRMIAFTASVTTLACVTFGLVPALRYSQADSGELINSGAV
jgi:hypothetical protein